jgi:predicted nucleic acid-binding protein
VRAIVLDTGPLGIITNPHASTINEVGRSWLEQHLVRGSRVIIPEIADYEIRRELLRVNRTVGLNRLDQLKTTLEYLPITTDAMLLAAQLWANARREGRPTADAKALDCDVILAAQTRLVAQSADSVIVATTNVAHIARFVEAAEWKNIPVD